MASDTLSSIQYSLMRNEQELKDLTTKVWREPIAGLFRDGNGITTIKDTGRGLVAYFNDTIVPAGGWGYVSEGGDYPAVQAEEEIQPYITMRHYALTIGFSEQALIGMEHSGRGPALAKTKGKITRAVDGHQRRIARACMGRGDGFVARIQTAGTSTQFTSEIPVRCVVGDIIYADADSSGNGRGLGGATTIDGIRVTNVDYVNRIVTLASSQTFTEHDVVYLASAAHNAGGAGVYPHGIEAMYDDAAGDNTQWDSVDDSTYDHVDTYMGLTRSTTTQANPIVINIADSPNLSNVGKMVAAALAAGADPDRLFLLCNNNVYQAYADSVTGFAPLMRKIQLPGGVYTIPVLVGNGQAEIKVICDWGMPDNKMVLIDESTIYRITVAGGWNTRTGSMWKQNAISSAGPFAAGVSAAFDTFFGLANNLPGTSVLGYGVTTT